MCVYAAKGTAMTVSDERHKSEVKLLYTGI